MLDKMKKEKLGFFAKYSDLDEIMEQLTNLAENIKAVNASRSNSPEILEFCNDMIQTTKQYIARGETDGI